MRLLGVGIPPVETLAFAGVGFIAPPFIEGFVVPMLPAEWTSSTVGKYALKAGSVLVTTIAAKMVFGTRAATAVAIGGGIYILASLLMDFAPSLLSPGMPLRPAAGTAPAQTRAYVTPRRNGAGSLRSYVDAASSTQLGLPSAAFFNRESSGAVGGTAVRFKRF